MSCHFYLKVIMLKIVTFFRKNECLYFKDLPYIILPKEKKMYSVFNGMMGEHQQV